MADSKDPRTDRRQILELMSLHKYFLNADYLRDAFMRRIKRDQSPAETDPVTSMDDMIAMSLWYATLYVVIEGWRSTKLVDDELDALLSAGYVDKLRRFRNQIFHYQREYDNPRLLEFLGVDDTDAHAATEWVKQTHAALGRAIQSTVEALLVATARSE